MGAEPFGRTNLLKATLLIVTGVLAACLVALVGTTEPVKAAFPGENGNIVFDSNRNGKPDIYTMNADGTGQTNLTNNPFIDRNPVLSPDGAKIAFASDRDNPDRNQQIYAMNADGSGQTNLTNKPDADNVTPAFSPDGTKIVFSSYRNGKPDIYIMNADGTEQTNLTNDSANDIAPTFSPDGKKIAFSSRRDGNAEIHVMNADGSGQTNLTKNPFTEDQPAFSADGTRIAFISLRDGNYEIYVMNADGSGQTNLTNDPDAGDFEPTFSPDGKKIAFSSYRDGNAEIHTMNAADGSGQENLTNDPAYDANPDWGLLATRYNFTGFYSPVDNLPTFNKAKAGSAIPVKFSLGGDQGLDVFARDATGNATTSPTSGAVACDSTAEIDPIETTASAGSSGLSYDAASDTYTYVWKTQKGWTGCRQLVVEFDDGTVERANFKFVK